MRHGILILFLLSASILLLAQEKSPLLTKAESAYESGRFERVISLLDGTEMEKFDLNDKIQAYRILSLSCLYLDRQEEAEEYAGKILTLDPFYTPYGDSPRFADLLARLKKRTPTVTTASKLEETVEEVPVPVTLITEEMIRACGAISLQEVLLQYVPGLSAISSLEDNVAMRGVYGLTQEGILVMLDGHRMNSSTTNGEPFDFRNNIDKIKRIEVLRGPASSLYGNVSLTGVVNIITRDGTDLEGGKISLISGNHKRAGGSLMFGNGNLKFDFLVWGSVYYSKGEQIDESTIKGPHYIGGYNSKPTLDFGAKLRWDDFKLEITGRHGHPIPQFNILDIFGCYDYYKYATVGGDGPGMARTDIRADVDWSHKWNKFTLSATGHAASENQQVYNCLSDTLNQAVLDFISAVTGLTFKEPIGTRQIIDWNSYNFGVGINGTYDYRFNNGMSGSAIAGVQYENLTLGDANMSIGYKFTDTDTTSHTIIPKGGEHTISTFLQIKHYFTRKLIFNGGIRLDHKIRLDGREIFTASPRLALIWMPNPILTVKGGYSHAFVDAAAFYRVSNIKLFSGGPDLNPEKMDSFQAGVILNWKNPGLRYELNCFYNKVTDLVYYDIGELVKGKTMSFTNAGHLSVGGFENVFQYQKERWLTNLNCTLQYPLDSGNYYTSENATGNVPNFMLNATAQWAAWKGQSGSSLLIRTGIHFQTGFNCRANNLMTRSLFPDEIFTYWVSPYTLLNAGIEWRWAKGLDVSFDVRNILNEEYQIGGQLYQGFMGESVNLILKLSYKFPL